AARVKSGQLSAVDASALRTLTQATGSAIRALANPQDPGFAFAAEFVGTLVNDGVQGLQQRGQGEGIAQPAPENPHAAFRAAEHEDRRASDGSVAGTSYRAQAGDSISRIVGSSDPQAIGNFMRANNLTSDHIEIGRNYFVPLSVTAYGDSAALGWHALNQSNARHAVGRGELQAWPFDDGPLRMDGGSPGSFAALAVSTGQFAGVPGTPAGSPEGLDAALAAAGVLVLPTPIAAGSTIAAQFAKEFARAVPVATVGVLANLALVSPLGREEVTSLNDDHRFVKQGDERLGQLQQRDANGDWQTVRNGVALYHTGTRFAVLSDEELQCLRAPVINVPPTVPQGTPGYLPANDEQLDGRTPGYGASPEVGPEFTATPMDGMSIEDLLIFKRDSAILGTNLSATGELGRVGDEAHHIVPSRAGGARMQAVRQLLTGLGVDLNSAVNGVWLPGANAPDDATGAYHPRLNNDDYNRAIEKAFIGVTTREQAEDALQRIKGQLQDGAFPGVRPRGG
ncbi:AHH domain-containing protein, partial [Piscinibacter sp.]|uniref:AHH domain-containing protein n=1 Tax=Piscinibacter sp. TaxID=1903157 RepID=UPI002CA2C815